MYTPVTKTREGPPACVESGLGPPDAKDAGLMHVDDAQARLPFESLDFVYMPAADTAAEAEHFASALGGRIGWAIEAFGARVAMVELAAGPPHLLLADHLEGERPILVYRVNDLDDAIESLTQSGATEPAR